MHLRVPSMAGHLAALDVAGWFAADVSEKKVSGYWMNGTALASPWGLSFHTSPSTSVRLKVEQNQLVSGVGRVDLWLIGPQGA